jgi:hypothetical protein
MAFSPYRGLPQSKWRAKTEELIYAHPLDSRELVAVTLGCWDSIFKSKIGPKEFLIGTHLFPKPQIMAFFLHELISLEFSVRYPTLWRGEQAKGDKDLVYIPDDCFSVEIKTSSHGSQIFGNRSYAQATTASQKSKSGYYLAVNFEKFSSRDEQPRIRRIRFGWLDHSDWIGQKAATGQQARLSPRVEQRKLLTLFETE